MIGGTSLFGGRGNIRSAILGAMVIMSIALTIFTTGFLQVYRTVNKTESLSTAQAQVTIAFQRLDREVRYASAISAPAQVGPDYDVEYLITPALQAPAATPSPTPGRTPTCVELRLRTSTQQLQRRSWPQGDSPVTPTAWVPLISGITAVQPFTLIAALPGVSYYQALQVKVMVTSGNGDTRTVRGTDVTFTALNTTAGTLTNDMCTEGRTAP